MGASATEEILFWFAITFSKIYVWSFLSFGKKLFKRYIYHLKLFDNLQNRFGFYNNFAGQTLYDSFIYQLFNIFYASLPIIVFSIFDKEYPSLVLVQNKINYYEDGLKSNK